MADVDGEKDATNYNDNLRHKNKRKFKKECMREELQPPEWEDNRYFKKKRFDKEGNENVHKKSRQFSRGSGGETKSENESNDYEYKIKQVVVYYEKVLQIIKQELGDRDSKDMFIENTLKASEHIEVDISCHAISSHCLELLLTECENFLIMQRFMCAFSKDKIPVCTSPNASHITEILIHYAVKKIQNWSAILDSEDSTEKEIASYCMTWLLEFGDFALQYLNDCLSNTYSCHVLCTLVNAFAGDLSKATELISKSSKAHKQEFRSQYIDKANESQEKSVVLEQIPKPFSKVLKNLAKSLIKSENLHDYVSDSSSATVIEALLFALKKRIPKTCIKIITKMAQVLFLEKNQDGVPLHLLHKNSSFVINEMFKAAEQNLQVELWNTYIAEYLGKLVVHSVGNFVIQRLFDAIQDKFVFEVVCEAIWSLFDEILKSRNFGIFVSIANGCNRLSAQQAPFMMNIMQCLHCHEPTERQNLLVPLVLCFRDYESYISSRNSCETNLIICLQGSLLAQAILKFHKPIKAVQSILSMSPSDIEFLTGHIQGCHVLNAYFGSIGVGEKNKEKLLNQLKPVIVSIACDRNKSLTLSRIWVILSLKLKEIIARELAQNKEIVRSNSNGYVILKKFGIHYFKRLQDWKDIQSNISCNKKTIK